MTDAIRRPGSEFPRVLGTCAGKPYAHEVYLMWFDGRLAKAHCADCRKEHVGNSSIVEMISWAFEHRPDHGDVRVIVDKPQVGPFWNGNA